jgi:uncharacterized protein
VAARPLASGRLLGPDDIAAIALGCAVFGAGGGGNVETGSWAARHALEVHGDVPLVSLRDLEGEDLVLPMHAIGAPTVSQELLPSGREPRLIRAEVERALGRPVRALMPGEIGGANGVRSVGWAADLGLPLLDADGMVLGNVTAIRPVEGMWAERLARAVCVASGSTAVMTSYVMTAAQASGSVIEGSMSRAIEIGQLLLRKDTTIAGLCQSLRARQLVSGKITELDRSDVGGFVRGSVVITGAGPDNGRLIRLEFQNENLIALEDGVAVATVPDLIVVLDSETAHALGTDGLRYGQRVAVIAWPSDPLWRTEAGLSKAGPAAFGYHLAFRPIEESQE